MKYEPKSAGTFWQLSPDEKFMKTVASPIFDINCCGCKGSGALNTFFCDSSNLGIFVTKALSLYSLDIYYGPYCADVDKQKLISWGDYALTVADKVSATSMNITPPYFLFKENPELKQLYDDAFLSLGFTRHEKHTVVLDTTRSKDDILKKMKYETRRSVRRVSESDIVIEKLSDPRHVKEWQEIKGRTNAESCRIINSIVDAQSKNHEYYVALNGDTALAWTGVKWGEDIGYLEGITTSPATRKSKENKFANYALQWFIIEEALRRGVKAIDYAGVEPNSDDKKLLNIMKFKLSWGGELVEYATYSYEVNKLKSNTIIGLRKIQGVLNDLLPRLVEMKKKLEIKKD